MVRITLLSKVMPKVATPVTVKYGLLYNWYAATDVRNICADGWHIGNKTECETLRTEIGGSTNGYKLKETGFDHWDSPNTGATNEYLFNARGGGSRLFNGTFASFKTGHNIWTSTQNDATYAFDFQFQYNSVNFGGLGAPNNKKMGNGIRPMRDATETELSLDDGLISATYTGNDGKVYRCTKIGTQVWIADNLAETKFRNGDTIPEVTDNSAWAALTTGALCAYNNDWSNVLI